MSMISINASISSFFVAILSGKAPVSVRAENLQHRFLKFFLLPFLFAITLFALTPAPALAQATPNPTPGTAGTGTFDCLGEFDWGCQVVGYLFENKGLQGETLFNTATGTATAPVH